MRKIVYVDPTSDGHHPEQLAFYARVADDSSNQLLVLTTQSTWEAAQQISGGLPLGITLEEETGDIGAATIRERWRYLARVLDRYATEDYAFFFPLLDPFVAPLFLVGLLRGGLHHRWSGVYFRDAFNYRPRRERGLSNFLRARLKLALLRHIVRAGCASLLTYNERWVKKLPVPVVWLPDALSSLDALPRFSDPLAAWPVPNPNGQRDRTVFLLFGGLKARKGVLEVLEALGNLPSHYRSRIELRIVGKFTQADFKPLVMAAVDAINRTDGKILVQEGFASPDTLDKEIVACDVILAPYVDHVGSSGIVGIAARYGRPIIGQDTFQVGEETKLFDLGRPVDTSKPEQIGTAMAWFVDHGTLAADGMRRFKESRTPQAATAVIRPLFAQLAGG